jgi:hypothetical protein
MSTLVIFPWFGTKREVHFVGFNRDHTACFIRDEENARHAISLHLPNFFKLRFHKNPIAQNGSPPVEISRAVLHVPACFFNKAEKENYDDLKTVEVECAAISGEIWKAVTMHKCWLEAKDNAALEKLLRKEMRIQRRRFAFRNKEVNKQIALLPSGDVKRAEELRNMLKGEFTTIANGQNGASKFISIFNTTLKMVRHGWGGLREKLLESEWAKHFGVNLKDIPIQSAAFRAWIERIAYNTRRSTTDWKTRILEQDVCLQLYPWEWEVLEAAVQYEIRFADNSRCWLDDINERNVADPTEVEDFDKLEQATEIRGDERLSLEEVCRLLSVKWKGQTRPIGKRGLQKLCEKAHVCFEFPMRRSLLNKLEKHRANQRRRRDERLNRHNRQAREQKAGLTN